MIQQALEYLVGLGKANNAGTKFALPGNRVGVFYNGALSQYDGDRQRVKGTVDSLGSLVDWCDSRADVTLWVGPEWIRADSNYETPHEHDVVQLKLDLSQAANALSQWVASAGYPQRQVVRALRGPLADCFDGRHLAVFKNLDFARTNDGRKTIEHAKESLGRAVESRAQSSQGEIPEVLAFSVPMFTLESLAKYTLRYAVEVDSETERISIQPIGDCVEQAFSAARQEIVELLKSRLPEASVYLGA